MTSPVPLAEDLLRGADEIAEFLLGDRRKRRLIYHLVENRSIPTFKLGAQICARRSTLTRVIEEREARSVAAGE